jgi:hypothetical protein
MTVSCTFGSAVLTYFDGSTKTGSRYSYNFVKYWIGCHDYFPVKVLMWDGKGYVDHPTSAHDEIFDVASKSFILCLQPHGAIPMGAAVFPVQLTRVRVEPSRRSFVYVSRPGRTIVVLQL